MYDNLSLPDVIGLSDLNLSAGSFLLVDLSIKSFLLLTVALFFSYVLRKRSAAATHRLWTLSFCGCLILPIVSIGFPTWSLPILPESWFATNVSPDPIVKMESSIPSIKESVPNQADLTNSSKPENFNRPNNSGELANSHPIQNGLESTEAPKINHDPIKPKEVAAIDLSPAPSNSSPPITKIPEQVTEAKKGTFSWPVVCFTIWIGGIFFFLMQAAYHHICLLRILKNSSIIHDETWNQATRYAAYSLGLNKKIVLRKVDNLLSPMIAGLFRPVVLLPGDADNWNPTRRHLVLLHELAHAKRKDVLTQTVARFVCALNWINPVCWFGLFQMRKLRELACDDLVIASGQRPSEYADILLDVAKSYQHRYFITALGMTRSSNLEHRILSLLDKARSHVSLSRRGARVLFLSTMTIVVLIGTMKLKSQSVPPSPAVALKTGDSTEETKKDQDGNLLSASPSDSQSEPNAQEIFKKVEKNGAIQFESATGSFVKRIYNHGGKEKKKKDMANLRKGLEEARKKRISNDLKFGIKTDIAALEAEDAAIIKEMNAKTTDTGILTLAVKYIQQRDSYRIESLNLPDDIPLKTLCEDFKKGKRKFEPTFTRTWNGKQHAELVKQESKKTFTTLHSTNRSKGVCKFTTYSRESAESPMSFNLLTKLWSSSVSTKLKTKEGDPSYLVKFGNPDSRLMYLEMSVLPEKGYCIESSLLKTRGVNKIRETYRDFVKTSAGFWLPMQIMRESYGLDKNKSTIVVNKLELLAFERPKTNVPLPENVFDLAKTKEFKSVPVTMDFRKPVAKKVEKVKAEVKPETVSLKTAPVNNKEDSLTRTMKIRVLDNKGKPIEKAKIHTSFWNPENKKVKHKLPRNSDDFTNNKGIAIIKIPRELHLLRLWARKKAYVPEFVNFAQGTHDEGKLIPESFEFRLSQGSELSGVIVDDQGKPIPGVSVDVKIEHPQRSWNLNPSSKMGTWLAEDSILKTDKEGRWKIDNAPGRKEGEDYQFRLKITHDNYISDSAWGGLQKQQNVTTKMLRDGTAKIVLIKGIRIVGTVRDSSNKPVVKGLIIWNDEPYGNSQVCETQIEKTGRFQTIPLAPGKHPITVVAPGFQPERRMVNVSQTMDELSWTLKPGKRLTLKIVDKDDNPIPKSYVGLRKWRGVESLYNHRHSSVPNSRVPDQSDNNGLYVWDWAPEDPVTYQVGAKGYNSLKVTLTARKNEHVIKLNQLLIASGKVTNKTTGKLINNYRVTPVIVFRPNFYTTRFNSTSPSKNGLYELQLCQGSEDGYRYTLRIDADGYRSVLSKKTYGLDDGNVEEDFSLEPAEPLEGIVVDQDGKPVPSATVVTSTPTIVPSLDNGSPGYGSRSIKTSGEGKFQLAATIEPRRILVNHKSGYANVLRKPDEDIGTIKLQPWAKVSGKLIQDGKPVPDQTVYFWPAVKGQLGEPRFQTTYSSKTDKKGHFEFNKLPPIAGSFQTYLGPWQDSILTSSQSLPFNLQPGDNKIFTLGGNGITVTGKVVSTGRGDVPLNKNWSINYLVRRDSGLPISKDFPKLSFNPSDPVRLSWFLDPNYTSWLKTRQNYFVKLAPDGQLRISGVPPGEYDLVLKLYEQPSGCLVNTIGEKIVPITITNSDITSGKKEIGSIEVECKVGPQVGDGMHNYKFTDSTGREHLINDMKGRYVLMHVWTTWCAPCLVSMPDIQSTIQNSSDIPITFVGLNIDQDLAKAKDLTQKKGWNWTQNYLGDESDMARQLAISSVPTYYLIGPDSLLAASTNKWSEMKETIKGLSSSSKLQSKNELSKNSSEPEKETEKAKPEVKSEPVKKVSQKVESTIQTKSGAAIDKEIRIAIKKPNGELTKADLEKVTEIKINNEQITDLESLSQLPNLVRLEASNNYITDLAPLSNLKKLNVLFLSKNNITNLTPLAGLTNLKRLDIHKNDVSNLKPLAGLTELVFLSVTSNRISSLNPLQQLTKLERIDIAFNQISSLKPLAEMTELKILFAFNNKINDLEPLQKLTKMETLLASSNQISDLSPIKGLTKMTGLMLGENQISDLKPLKNFSALMALSINRNQITDLSPLANLKNLDQLSLQYNQITDISLLSNLTNLKAVMLDNTKISELDSLTGLKKLERLLIRDCPGLSRAEINRLKKALPKCKVFDK